MKLSFPESRDVMEGSGLIEGDKEQWFGYDFLTTELLSWELLATLVSSVRVASNLALMGNEGDIGVISVCLPPDIPFTLWTEWFLDFWMISVTRISVIWETCLHGRCPYVSCLAYVLFISAWPFFWFGELNFVFFLASWGKHSLG
jgi:hypothetical protein